MFENLTDRLESVFKKLRGHGKLTEENIQEAMGEVRTALLEADVNFGVVKEFVAAVTAKAIGQEVLSSLSPGQQVVKVVHDELVQLLGSEAQPLRLDDKRPAVIMLAGLQGSGKTTTAAKLAKQLKAQGRDAFAEYFVAEAAIALKQGAGRLIRTETDRGLLVVCDTRLLTARYGPRLLAAMPSRSTLESGEQALAFLRELAA